MTIFGADMSHYDSPPAGSRLVAEGFSFITHKAGGDANDTELGAWWNGVKGSRGQLLPGAYWVLYPGSPTSRADMFLSRLDDQCPGWRDGPFILQIDAEIWGGDSATKPSVAECNTFADRLRAKAPKLMPIGYLPDWVYGDSVSAFRYPLWASSYVSGSGAASDLYPGDNSSHWASYGGRTPDVLQFSSSATIVGQTTCDANAYRGTLAELTNLLAPGWEIDMPFTADDLATMMNTDGVLASPAGSVNSDGTPNAYWAFATYVKDTNAKVRQLQSAVAVLAAKPGATVDVASLAADLEPLINGMTADQIKDALVSVLKGGTDSVA
jgi:lysozyme